MAEDDNLSGDPAADAKPPRAAAFRFPLGCIAAFFIFGLLVAFTLMMSQG